MKTSPTTNLRIYFKIPEFLSIRQSCWQCISQSRPRREEMERRHTGICSVHWITKGQVPWVNCIEHVAWQQPLQSELGISVPLPACRILPSLPCRQAQCHSQGLILMNGRKRKCNFSASFLLNLNISYHYNNILHHRWGRIPSQWDKYVPCAQNYFQS